VKLEARSVLVKFVEWEEIFDSVNFGKEANRGSYIGNLN